MAKQRRVYGYDSKCYELAEHFLSDEVLANYENDVIEQFAMFIQKEVEDWLTYDLALLRKDKKDESNS